MKLTLHLGESEIVELLTEALLARGFAPAGKLRLDHTPAEQDGPRSTPASTSARVDVQSPPPKAKESDL